MHDLSLAATTVVDFVPATTCRKNSTSSLQLVLTVIVCNTSCRELVSVDLRIYRAFFGHTRYEMRKDDNRGRGSNEHKEATRKWKV